MAASAASAPAFAPRACRSSATAERTTSAGSAETIIATPSRTRRPRVKRAGLLAPTTVTGPSTSCATRSMVVWSRSSVAKANSACGARPASFSRSSSAAVRAARASSEAVEQASK